MANTMARRQDPSLCMKEWHTASAIWAFRAMRGIAVNSECGDAVLIRSSDRSMKLARCGNSSLLHVQFGNRGRPFLLPAAQQQPVNVTLPTYLPGIETQRDGKSRP